MESTIEIEAQANETYNLKSDIGDAKGGDYSEKTLRAFAEAYVKIFEKEAERKAGINEE